ncbi:MAG TPA: MOP flippase family protein [Gaiellaceae bacterium]|jgi:O-antigen/teichoic acid export membrane protein|nr:MOP flippase family protein [Gaiellaceae bacterium]
MVSELLRNRWRRVTTARDAPESLRSKVIGGAGWTLLSQAVVQATRLAVAIALARLLTPEDFGLAAMAIVFATLASLFADLSLGAALIQRPEIDELHRSTIFWTTVGLGVLVTLAGVALAGPVASFFGEPEVRSLFAVLSLLFLLNSLGVVQWALLSREMAFRSLQLREMGSVAIGGLAGIGVALAGLGPWAIVTQTLVTAATALLLLWRISPWRPRLVFSGAVLRDAGGFGLKLFGSRLLSYANTNLDNVLVGRFLGASALGVYALAYNVMFAPVIRLAAPLHNVLFPAFSRLQDDEPRLVRAWLQSKRVLAAVLVPIFLAMIALAPDLIRGLFGQKWSQAVPVLQLLATAGVAHTFVVLNWSLLQARGRAGQLLLVNIITSIAVVTAFAVGIDFGLVGVAGLFALAKWLLIVPDTWITTRSLPMRRLDAVLAVGSILPAGVAAFGLAWGVRVVLEDVGLPVLARLVIAAAVGAFAYLALLRLRMPGLAGELTTLVRGGRPPNDPDLMPAPIRLTPPEAASVGGAGSERGRPPS